MKFLSISEVLQSIPLVSDSLIKEIIQEMALETYSFYLMTGKKPEMEKAMNWMQVIQMDQLPPVVDIRYAKKGLPLAGMTPYKASQSMWILLAYVVLKSMNKDIKWTIHSGSFSAHGQMIIYDLLYLQAGEFLPEGEVPKEVQIGDMCYELPLVVSLISEDDLLKGSIVMNDIPIKDMLLSDPRFYQQGDLFLGTFYQERYKGKPLHTYVPSNKDEMMKWLRSEGYLLDKHVQEISSSLDQAISGSGNMSNLLSLTYPPDIKEVMMFSVMKIRASRMIEKVMK